MKIKIQEMNDIKIAEIISDKIEIENTQDALDIMANSDYRGSRKIILHEKNITTDFFDLKTKLAGEILQKFSNYDVYLAIIGNFTKYSKKSFQDFIKESNKYGRINFVKTKKQAIDALTRN